MKNIFAILFLSVITLTSYAQKFAYVDSDYILERIPEYQSAQDKLEKVSLSWQTEIEEIFEEIDQLYKKFQADQILLTQDMKQRRESEIIGKEKEAKEYKSEAYFIVITARGELEDKIKGFDLGADDYLPKPFSLLELLSRIQAITRRKFGQKMAIIEFGDFALDTSKRNLRFKEHNVDLTKKEYKLLNYLVLNN